MWRCLRSLNANCCILYSCFSSDSIPVRQAPPIKQVSEVGGGGGSVGMLTIKWLPLAKEDHGGDGLYYKVYWRLHRHQNDKWESVRHFQKFHMPMNHFFFFFLLIFVFISISIYFILFCIFIFSFIYLFFFFFFFFLKKKKR